MPIGRKKREARSDWNRFLEGWRFTFLLSIASGALLLSTLYLISCRLTKDQPAGETKTIFGLPVSISDCREESSFVPVSVNNDLEGLGKNYFGDSFSSDAYLDTNRSNFYFDYYGTTLTFTPRFSFTPLGTAAAKEGSIDGHDSACLASSCLAVSGQIINFEGQELSLPPEIETALAADKKVRLSVAAVGSEWLLGAVVYSDQDEYTLAYRFNGQDFWLFLGPGKEAEMKPEYGRQGGSLSFGGQEDDFLVIYNGYSDLAYRVRGPRGQEVFENLSEFFNLRMSGDASYQIISIAVGQQRSWFVCGPGTGAPRFVKLWENDEGKIIGSLNLGEEVSNSFRNLGVNPLEAGEFSCQAEEGSVRLAWQTNGQEATLLFNDQGFDNSHDYQAFSKNLNTTGKPVRAVLVRDYACQGDCQLSFSNNGEDWLPVQKGRATRFADASSTALFWRLLAPSGSAYYSPYFGHINDLVYYLGE